MSTCEELNSLKNLETHKSRSVQILNASWKVWRREVAGGSIPSANFGDSNRLCRHCAKSKIQNRIDLLHESIYINFEVGAGYAKIFNFNKYPWKTRPYKNIRARGRMSTTPKRVPSLEVITKPIGLIILLLNAQLNIGQQAAEAKNASGDATTLIVAQQSSQTNTSTAFCPSGLNAAIETVINRPQFSRERWGVLVQTEASGKTLYSHDAQKYFIPASNLKLLTTAAVLQLGAQFQIRTSVYATRNGALRVVGRGDPSLTDTQLIELAQQLKVRGIRQVNQVITDGDYFRGATVNPSWEWEDVQADYGAPVSSLILNQNAVKLTLFPQQVGQSLQVYWSDPLEAKQWEIENESITTQSVESTSINVSRESKTSVLKITGQLNIDGSPESVSLALVDPNEHFLRHFRRALAIEGISQSVTNNIAQTRAINKQQPLLIDELAVVKSRPLSELLKETNQNSNNLYAEALLRVLGARLGKLTTPTDTTLQMGLGVVKATLTQMGVDPSSYVLVDGSGLSRHNLITPQAIAQTLRAMAKSPLAPIYRASLPVAGISGTLENRLRDTPAEGIVQAKTGTVSGVVALSGYVAAPNYEPVVFSIIVNQSEQSAATLRQAIDEIVLLLTRLRYC